MQYNHHALGSCAHGNLGGVGSCEVCSKIVGKISRPVWLSLAALALFLVYNKYKKSART